MPHNVNASTSELLETVQHGQQPRPTSTDTHENVNEKGNLSPFKWPSRKKWTVTLVACLVCFMVGVNSTSITAAAEEINIRFSESDNNPAMLPVSYWPVTAWNAGAAIFPMIMLPIVSKDSNSLLC
jgi:hypothetical protein